MNFCFVLATDDDYLYLNQLSLLHQVCKHQWLEIKHKVKQGFQLNQTREEIFQDILCQLKYEPEDKELVKDWFTS